MSATIEARPRLFAVNIAGWQLGIEEGWEANLDTMRTMLEAPALLFVAWRVLPRTA